MVRGRPAVAAQLLCWLVFTQAQGRGGDLPDPRLAIKTKSDKLMSARREEKVGRALVPDRRRRTGVPPVAPTMALPEPSP